MISSLFKRLSQPLSNPKTCGTVRKRSRHYLKTLLVSVSILSLTTSQMAYAGRGGLIRDAETESLIRSYAKPILKAAGLAGQNIKIHLVNNSSFNAFVVDGQNMFIHVGAITQSKTPNQLIGVLAHETGHITGGHLARLRGQMKKAQSASMMLQILGLAAMIGGAFAGGSNAGRIGGAGRGIMGAGGGMVRRHVLAGRRIEEASADQAAIKFLNRTGQSGRGMLKTFEFFADQGLAGSQFVDPYVLSHPMPQTRIFNLRSLVKKSPHYKKNDSKTLQHRHDLIRAKLIAFMGSPRTTFSKYPVRDKSLPALYARAIASYNRSGLKSFLPLINKAIAREPQNPYFLEIKGEFLFKSGLALDAIPPLRKAVKLAPRSDLIRITLAQALITTGSKSRMKEAIRLLKKALVKESQAANGYRQLAIAYGRTQQISKAELATAQAYFYEGKLSDAKRHAKRAKGLFKRGTSYWIRADDIVSFNPPTR